MLTDFAIMNRRTFLKSTSLASTATLMPGFLSKLHADLSGKRILVILQLSGGNDGLNTFIPFQDDLYYKNRPRLGIKADEVLKVTDSQGFHPALDGLRVLFDEGLISVINSVGYPNPDRSHFRSMDIWHSGRLSEREATGWLGRYLDHTCANCAPHSAIEIGQSLSIAVQGAYQKALVMQSLQRLSKSVNSKLHQHLSSQQSDDGNISVDYMYKTLTETRISAQYLQEKLAGNRAGTGYPEGPLGNDLRTVSNLILAGCETSVYYISLSGFDTHVNQANPHERLLKQVGSGLKAFYDDMRLHGLSRDVSVLCFSEFGRRVKQNASGGTDHGAGNNLFVISEHLTRPGFFNGSPDLRDLDDGDVRYQVDFRDIYADVLERWLDVSPHEILGKEPTPVGLLT